MVALGIRRINAGQNSPRRLWMIPIFEELSAKMMVAPLGQLAKMLQGTEDGPMGEQPPTEQELTALAEIVAALQRAGLNVTADQAARLAAGYLKNTESFRALAQRLDQSVEPAGVYHPADVFK